MAKRNLRANWPYRSVIGLKFVLRKIRLSGAALLSVTSTIYVLLTVVVMFRVTDDFSSADTEQVEFIYWTALSLLLGAIALVFLQFVGNMYTSKPIGDLIAGLLAIGNFLVVLGAIAYFVNRSIGA